MSKYLSLLISLPFIFVPISRGLKENNMEEKEKMKKIFISVVRQKSENKHSNAQEFINPVEMKKFLDSRPKSKPNMNAIEYGDYVSGCELISIVNLLNHYGYNTSLDEFYNNFFEHQDWYMRDGNIYAPHPNYIYPGNPKIEKGDNCGFGCFGEAVKQSINNFFNAISNSESKFYNKYNIKHKVIFETSADKEKITKLLREGTPLIIWSTQANKKHENELYDMRKPGGPGASWIVTAPEKLKDEKYTWMRGEHCSIIYDYDESSYRVCDPFRKNIRIEKDSLDESREIFGNPIVYLTE